MEVSCVRENIEKLQKLPHEVHLLRNSIDSVHGDINTVGASCVKVKSDVTSILEEVRDADKIAHNVKTHVLGLDMRINPSYIKSFILCKKCYCLTSNRHR